MTRAGIVTSVVLILAACEADDPAPPPPADRPAEAAAATAPQPTAEAVWQHLQREDYTSWALWPGTQPRYEGSEPHGMLLTTYVNDLAQQALREGRLPLPDGAIIVKENYMPDGSFDASTVMVKRQGFNPEHHDWFWAKYDAAGVVEDAGRVEMCQACHRAAQQRDYLLTPLPNASQP
jgi:hypothetical protein